MFRIRFFFSSGDILGGFPPKVDFGVAPSGTVTFLLLDCTDVLLSAGFAVGETCPK